MTGVIEYICTNPEHRPPQDAPDAVFEHAGVLAYCPLAGTEDHDWRATGGKTLTTVREWLGRPKAA